MKLLISLIILFSPIFVIAQKELKTNAAILEFAEKNLGKKVGDGVCRTLTNQAVYEAQKKVYGKAKYIDYEKTACAPKINNFSKAMAGDIICFKEFYYANDDSTYLYMGKHIGILKSVDEEKIEFYNQNVLQEGQTTKKDSKVIITVFYFDKMVTGDISVHRIY